MQIRISSNTFFLFDLDDTLFEEIDFLKSAYSNISSKLAESVKLKLYDEMFRRHQNKENVFEWIVSQYRLSSPHLSVEWLLTEYRNHLPEITLSQATTDFLQKVADLKIPSGLITDGRSITQRNKLKALGIDNYFNDIIISEEFGSEKPDEKNYLYFQHKYPLAKFYFFGDNTSKDFIVPKKLGWQTICLKNAGNNIHAQSLISEPIPDHVVSSFQEISLIES